MSVNHFIEEVRHLTTIMTYADVKYDKKNDRHTEDYKNKCYYNYAQELVFNRSEEECYEFVNQMSHFIEHLLRHDMFDTTFSEDVKQCMVEYVGGDQRMMHTIYDYCYMVAKELALNN